MTTFSELSEAITTIEKFALKKRPTAGLSPHRWAQVLRILKFARLTWDVFHHHPAWSWRQDCERSPFFIKGRNTDDLTAYYKAHPELAIEPPINR